MASRRQQLLSWRPAGRTLRAPGRDAGAHRKRAETEGRRRDCRCDTPARRARKETRPARMTTVDPPDLPFKPTMWRLYPLWREQLRLALLALACAFCFTGLSLAIPVLIQRVVDNAIVGDDRSLLAPYLL